MTTSPSDEIHPGVAQVADELSLEEVAAKIRGTLAVVYRRIRQTKQLGDLTLPESSALGRFRHGGPMTSATLAKLEQISPQSIGVTVASLEAKGLVQRCADPSDGRRVILSLTSAGDVTVKAGRNARDRQLTRALSCLSAEERARLVQVMPVLQRLAEEL